MRKTINDYNVIYDTGSPSCPGIRIEPMSYYDIPLTSEITVLPSTVESPLFRDFDKGGNTQDFSPELSY